MKALQAADTCTDMSEVRKNIDALDQQLVALLAERATFINRAMELKKSNGWPANIPERVEQVVQNVRQMAEADGLDANLVDTLWRHLIDWSIDLEEQGLSRS